MNDIEKGLRAIHKALVEQGRTLEQIRFLLAAEVDYIDPTVEGLKTRIEEIARRQAEQGTDPSVRPAVRTFDPDAQQEVE